MDGVVREVGDKVYRDNITNKICNEFYRENSECSYCCIVEENIDLRDMTPTSYVPGDRITGSLDKLGCVVIRGIRIENV